MNKTSGNGLLSMASISFMLSILLSYQAYALEIHEKITGPFTSSGDVTAACLKCHHQQAVEVLQSTHWTWVRQRAVNGKNTLYGKKDSLTGFAIDVSSNPSRCMGCHISNTRPDVDFNAPSPEMVDCLVCHDTTGAYQQFALGAPQENNSNVLELMARNVGKSTPANCTTCHFADCGLPAITNPSETTAVNIPPVQDIHMDRAAISFSCQNCHALNSGHSFSRKMRQMNSSSSEEGCASCHTTAPHATDQLNQHTTAIACQTCHIPQYAQKKTSILSWNWIMTGKATRIYQNNLDNRLLTQDENGFNSATQLEPVYLWDDGGDLVYTRGQRINPQELTYLQRPSERSPKSKITPFRVIYGTQLYDQKYRYLISPLMQPSGLTFFDSSDWDNIARQGMQAIVLPFSGQFAFTPTVTFRRINHGVVSASKALDCLECHGLRSRLPWEKLGYNQDPWSGTAKVTIKDEKPGAEPDQLPTVKFEPVKESVILPGSSL